jgi:hypothetical protein
MPKNGTPMFNDWRDVSKEQVLEVLAGLKELFADQKKWIEWPEAVDEHGTEVDPLDEKAVAFSLMGASFKLAASKHKTPLANFIDCATRNFLADLSGESSTVIMLSYQEEYTLICMGLELLAEEGNQ